MMYNRYIAQKPPMGCAPEPPPKKPEPPPKPPARPEPPVNTQKPAQRQDEILLLLLIALLLKHGSSDCEPLVAALMFVLLY